MYGGYRSAVRGFGKSLHAGSGPWLVAGAAWQLIAYSVPWVRLRGRVWRWAALLGLAQRLLANAKTGRHDYLELALVPLTGIAALPVFAVALRRTATWKGRRYP